jgi:putative peptide zinc metalloprotease protein
VTILRSLSPRTLFLLVLCLALGLYLSVVASRTDVIAIIDTGDGDPLALATLALLDAGGGAVSAAGEDNYAVALNTEDGTTLAESAFLITYAASGVVDQTNAAIAYSSCEACRTFAFAIEVVLVPADKADIVTPTNAAIAVNEDCLSCETAAFATQIVLGVDGPVGFTEEGNEEIEDIMADLAQLEEDAGDLTLEEIQARYDELVARVNEVLANELVPLGNGGEGRDTESTVPEMTMETGEPTEATGPAAPSTLEETAPEATAPEATLPEATAAPEGTSPVSPTESSIPEGTEVPSETSPGTVTEEAPETAGDSTTIE